MQESSLARWDSFLESNHNCVRKGKKLFMKLNLFNIVNNEERRRGQWSVVWLKCGQPCLHHLHVLSTTFSCCHSLCLPLGSLFYPHPSPPPPRGTGAWFHWCGGHGWRAWVCQPWRHNSVWGLAVPKVEAPGYPGHPPPLSDPVVNNYQNYCNVMCDWTCRCLLTLLSPISQEHSAAAFSASTCSHSSVESRSDP